MPFWKEELWKKYVKQLLNGKIMISAIDACKISIVNSQMGLIKNTMHQVETLVMQSATKGETECSLCVPEDIVDKVRGELWELYFTTEIMEENDGKYLVNISWKDHIQNVYTNL